MMRLLICAVSACLGTLGSMFGMMTMMAEPKEHANAPTAHNVLTEKSRMISVPIIADNIVSGYVVSRFEYVADADIAKSSKVKLESIVADEAFKVIYSASAIDFQAKRKSDVIEITRLVRTGVNERLGSDAIKDVLVDSWSFLNQQNGGAGNANANASH